MSRPRPLVIRRVLVLTIAVLCPWGQAVYTGAPADADISLSPALTQPKDRYPVQVGLDSITPRTARPKSTLTIHGRLMNTARENYQGANVRLRYGSQPLTNRGQISEYANDTASIADPTNLARTARVQTLNAGASQTWTLRFPVKQMGLSRFGVYPLTIDLTDAAGRLIGKKRTFITYMPKDAEFKKTKVAWVWPLVDRPHRSDDSTFLDDGLETDLGSSGRLAGLAQAPGTAETAVTWVVDPGLLDDARAMTDKNGYTVDTGAGKPTTKPRSAAASDWLKNLTTSLNSDPIIATPYADPDIVALRRSKKTADIDYATLQGQQVTKSLLRRNPVTTTVWPPDGAIDQPTINFLARSGTSSMLLDDRNAPATQPQTYTQEATARQGRVRAVAYDSILHDVLGSDERDQTDVVSIRQRFLAETAMITGEQPLIRRTLVVAPPRRWRPDPRLARTLLADTSAVPWLKPVPLSDIEATRGVDREVTYPDSARKKELTRPYLRRVGKLSDRVRRYGDVLQPGATNGFRRGIPRTESAALREDADLRQRLPRAMNSELDADAASVELLADSKTLAGTRGVVPVSIANRLDKTVRVRLSAVSPSQQRLKISQTAETVTLGPEKTETVKVPMRAFANGTTFVRLQLLTPRGEPFGEPQDLRVNVTGFGGPVLIITGGALVVLFLGIGMRIVRRRRNGSTGTEEVST